MNVQCPSCETVYRIDPAKVPAEGVRARCAVCSFAIPLPGGAASAATAPTPTVPEPAFFDPPADEAAAETAVAEQLDSGEPETVAEPEAVAEPETIDPSYAAAVEEEAPPAVTDAPEVPEPEVVAEAPEPEVQPEEDIAPAAEAPDVRLSRPFVAPDYQEAAAPVQQVTRPTAPVFKPTPGAPVQDAPMPPVQGPAVQEAPAPPAQAPPIEAAPAPLEDAVVGDIAPAVPSEPETVAAPEPVAPVEQPARPINPFLQRDPKQKARRLARALISDMMVYQPQKRQETLENGTLKEAFEEEIKKSWEEYVDQVGEDMANSTGFFREALNEILAGGQELF